MPGNSFGHAFRVTTFGESHGDGIGAVVDGCPAGIPLSLEDFEGDMARRRGGTTPYDTPRKEPDRVEILSGVFEGRTTGTPIALFIRNRDADSKHYEVLRSLFRPGHADYTYYKKYGHVDFRGGGRSSARETAARVAAGGIARKLLAPAGIGIDAYTLAIGGVRAGKGARDRAGENPLRCPDPEAARNMLDLLRAYREKGDSLGGIVEIVATGCPAGLGEPVFGKLDGDLAGALMSVGAVKGIEVGAGFGAAEATGSQNNDPLTPSGFRTNHAGGILGGISNGEEIVLRAAVKPIPSIRAGQETIDREGRPATLMMEGRFDVCAIPRILVVLEAMTALVLADHWLRNRNARREGGA